MDVPHYYEIHIKGYLDTRWSDWFDGMLLQHRSQDETILTGCLPDQAALRGILTKLFNLGLVLVSVRQLEPEIVKGE